MTTNWTDNFQKLHKVNTLIDEIMEVYNEASRVYEQALIAMGQQTVVSDSKVASTKGEVNLTSELSSEGDYQ